MTSRHNHETADDRNVGVAEHTTNSPPLVPKQEGMAGVTMSSLEIAELTEKHHRNVTRDIRVMLVELHGEGGVLSFEHTQLNPQNGQSYPVFRLPRRELMVLLTGYSIALRAKVIDRWEQLELAATDPAVLLARALCDPKQARALLLTQVEQNAELQNRITRMEPAIDAFDRIARADGSLCLTEAAKAMQMRPKDFISYLSQSGWIYKRVGSANWLGYQARVASGLLEHKVTTVLLADGSEKVTEQVRVTPKGLTKLAILVQPALRCAAA